MNSKTNKFESEMMFRQIDIVHKQLKQLVMVLVQKFKSYVEPTTIETEHAKKNKDVNFLNQILLVANWVQKIDMNGVNDWFDPNHQISMP